MADPKKQSSPILVILCALGLLAFLLLVIYPNHRKMGEYDRQISVLKEDIALRRALLPIYRRLVEKATIAPSTQLKAPEKTALDMDDTGRLAQIFQEIAKTADLTLESVIPDVQNADPDNRHLLVEVVFRGTFFNVQPLINAILERSYVDRILKIQVRSAEEKHWIKLSMCLFHH